MEIGLRSMERPEQIVDFQCRFAFDACPPLSAVLPRSQVVPGKLEILLAAAQPMSLFYLDGRESPAFVRALSAQRPLALLLTAAVRFNLYGHPD